MYSIVYWQLEPAEKYTWQIRVGGKNVDFPLRKFRDGGWHTHPLLRKPRECETKSSYGLKVCEAKLMIFLVSHLKAMLFVSLIPLPKPSKQAKSPFLPG